MKKPEVTNERATLLLSVYRSNIARLLQPTGRPTASFVVIDRKAFKGRPFPSV
jgi:hypothetical protein